MTALCTAPRHGDDEAQAEAHAALCRPCRTGLTRDLRRLPGLHADLEQLLLTQRAGGSGGNGTGLPVNEAAADSRSQIRHDLTWWCRHVTTARGLDAPPVPGGDWPGDPVAVMAGWLAGQVTWCSFRPWAGDMAGAIGDSAGRARALLDPWVTKRFEIPGRDGVCLACAAGRVEVTVFASDGDRRRSFIACPACGERWEPEQWAAYGKQIIRRRETAA